MNGVSHCACGVDINGDGRPFRHRDRGRQFRWEWFRRRRRRARVLDAAILPSIMRRLWPHETDSLAGITPHSSHSCAALVPHRLLAAGHAVVVARSGIGTKRTIRRQIPSDGERHVPPRATTLLARSETGCLTDDALLTAPARTVRIVAHAHSCCFRIAFADDARAARASAADRLAGRMRTCRNGDDNRRLDQLDGSAIDPNAKQRIRFLPLTNAVVELCLPVELIRCEVKINIAGDRKRAQV